LIHARRNFINSHEAFPDEITYVIERIENVYKNEGFTKQESMNPQRRMEYHQQNSASIMEEIKTYAQAKLEKKEVEANSVLGGAFKYLIQFSRITPKPCIQFMAFSHAQICEKLDREQTSTLFKTLLPFLSKGHVLLRKILNDFLSPAASHKQRQPDVDQDIKSERAPGRAQTRQLLGT
jgi:hypothetical protein